MKSFFVGFLMAAVLFTGGFLAYRRWIEKGPSKGPAQAAAKYHCPMHPAYISDKPGDCPICGMKLVPIEDQKSENAAPAADSHGAHGAHGMGGAEMPAGERGGSEAAPAVTGYATVTIPKDRIQMMGITLAEVRRTELDQNIRTFGRVTYDETKVHHVHTKFEGFIEDLYVNYTGQFVNKGQPLFSIYSPELYATQNEYLLALRAREQTKLPSGINGMGSASGIDLVAAAEQRLGLWDIGPAQIAELKKTRKPLRAMTINSPVSGFVISKTALQGLRVMPGDNLYDIVDLSTAWVQVDIYEVNLPFVKVGQPASLTLPYQPGKIWRGRVVFINPTVDPATRTIKGRLEFANPNNELKPDMYADVVIGGVKGKGLTVPESAVIATGERNILFVARGEGVFEPREVTLGVKVLNLYEIKQGVSEGEKVVTGANFLLDSESKLKAAVSGSAGGHKHGM